VRGLSELERKLSIETGVAWLFGGGVEGMGMTLSLQP